MFLYKLKKLLKENWTELLKSSAVLAFFASMIPFFSILFINSEDFTTRDKKQMFIVSIICVIISLLMINYVDSNWNFNIIVSMFVGSSFSFGLFFITILIFLITFEYRELKLDKSELREAKINSLLRKLF